MSDLLTLVLSNKYAATRQMAGIDDVRIKFAKTDTWKVLKKHRLIGNELRKVEPSLDLQADAFADVLVAMVEIKRAHVLINLLVAPEDPVRSQYLLTHGSVLAKGRKNTSAFISALMKRHSASGSPWLFATESETTAVNENNAPEFFVVGDPNIETNDGRQIVNRAEELIGDREKAEAWFKYEPLPAFENKTPRQLVDEGRSDAVHLHLDTLEDGIYA